MNLHSLHNTKGARRTAIRLGRGARSGKGKTCGRGSKGAYARSGHKHKPGFEGGQMKLARQLPKRGFGSPNRREFAPVNVEALAVFDDGAQVDPAALQGKGIVRDPRDGIKILGTGEIAKKLTVRAHAFSAGARAKIEAAGGRCEVVGTAAA